MNNSQGHISPGMLATIGITLLMIMVLFSHMHLQSRLRMVGTQFNFSEAVQVAQQALSAHFLDENKAIPVSTGEWIALFNHQAGTAPQGGPAFIVNQQGNPTTGAIGVSATNFGNEVRLTRPAYVILTQHTAVISMGQPLSSL